MDAAGQLLEKVIADKAVDIEDQTDKVEGLMNDALTAEEENTSGTVAAEDQGFFQKLEQAADKFSTFAVSAVDTLQIVVKEISQYCTDEYNLYSKFVDLTAFRIGFGIPLTVSPFLLLVSVALMTTGKYYNERVTQWFLLPLFSFCTFITTMGCTVFWAGFIIYIDFCTGAPDEEPEEQARKIEYAASVSLTIVLLLPCFTIAANPYLRFVVHIQSGLSFTRDNCRSTTFGLAR